MQQDQTIVTRNLLHFCYTCDHACECDSEETSVNCWAEQGFVPEEIAEENMTAELLRQYAF